MMASRGEGQTILQTAIEQKHLGADTFRFEVLADKKESERRSWHLGKNQHVWHQMAAPTETFGTEVNISQRLDMISRATQPYYCCCCQSFRRRKRQIDFSSRVKNDVGVTAPSEPKTSFLSLLGISGSKDLPTWASDSEDGSAGRAERPPHDRPSTETHLSSADRGSYPRARYYFGVTGVRSFCWSHAFEEEKSKEPAKTVCSGRS